MNQILVSEKLYITPELKRKKRMYKIDFFISIFLVCILFSYYIYAEYDKNKNEAISKEILSNMSFKDKLADDTTIKFEDNSIVVILNTEDPFYVNYSEPVEDENTEDNIEWFETERGTRYYTIARINIPSIDCDYPILNMIDPTEEQMEEVLKISPVKFWGADPNEVGNFCIVGHNYRDTRFFSKVPTLENGDLIEITDLSGKTINYQVYNKYEVVPEDTSCTSQLTDGKKEITLITCTNDNKHRVIVKARAI